MRLISAASLAALSLVAALGAATCALSADAPREPLVITTKDGARNFSVEIANDDRERALGLMFRRSMPNDEGMLFDFVHDEPAAFWMHNTYIPLDMLFIRADGTIESIAERTTPLSDKTVESKGPVHYVLEINGGLSGSLGIMPGDKVSGAAMTARP